MKKYLFLTFILISNILLSQSITLIYIDNSKSISRATVLSDQLEKVIKINNNEGTLILGNTEMEDNRSVNKSKRFDLQDENLINSLDDICMTKTNSQKGKDIIYSIKKDLDKISPTKMNNVTQEKALDLHFFFDIENYVYLDFKKQIIQLITDWNLNPEKTKITLHIDFNVNDKILEQELVSDTKNNIYTKFNLKINQY